MKLRRKSHMAHRRLLCSVLVLLLLAGTLPGAVSANEETTETEPAAFVETAEPADEAPEPSADTVQDEVLEQTDEPEQMDELGETDGEVDPDEPDAELLDEAPPAEILTLNEEADEDWEPGDGEIVVISETEFRNALTNATYTTIYLGTDIIMTTSTVVTVADRTLVINGADPREGGTRHSYTDYSGASLTTVSLQGAGTNITFRNIDVTIRNPYGIFRPTSNGGTVTLDGVTGQGGRFFYGYDSTSSTSTLVIKDSTLRLTANQLVYRAGTARLVGNVTVTRTVASSAGSCMFTLTGTSTVEVAAGATVYLDNNVNTPGILNRTIFYDVTNFIVGAGATLTCYSGQAFSTSSPANTLTNVTIGEYADVRLIQTGGSHTYHSFYGVSGSTFTAEAGSKFLLYDHESDTAWGAFYFANVYLNNPEYFIVMNANSSSQALGTTYRPNLYATGVSSIRYYSSGQISSLFSFTTSSYAYTPTRNPSYWWVQSSPFNVNATSYWSASPTISTNYASGSVPTSSITIQTSITSSIFTAGSSVNGIEIYGTIYTVTYDGNNAESGAAPASDTGVPNDLITVMSNTGNLAREGYTFAGWNTQADGNGTPYSAGSTFRITRDTTLYAQWTPNRYTVSGKVSGLASSTGVTITYTIDDGDAQTVTTESGGSYTITNVPHDSTILIMPSAQAGYSVTPASIAISSISANSIDKDFTYKPYTVTEKHVDESGNLIPGVSDTEVTVPDPPYDYSYGGLPAELTAGGDTYVYVGYSPDSYDPDIDTPLEGAPSIIGLTADRDMYIVYHRITDTINVTFPTGARWDFYVDQNTYPNVETGAIGSSGEYYAFQNNSDKPVYVDLTEVQEIAGDGLNLVADASLSVLAGTNSYSLELIAADSSILPSGTTNGFGINTVAGITVATYAAGTMRLGALDGQYVRQDTSTSAIGYVAIGGYYAGALTDAAKSPQLRFTFTFSFESP